MSFALLDIILLSRWLQYHPQMEGEPNSSAHDSEHRFWEVQAIRKWKVGSRECIEIKEILHIKIRITFFAWKVW